jgi:hypothetical protein
MGSLSKSYLMYTSSSSNCFFSSRPSCFEKSAKNGYFFRTASKRGSRISSSPSSSFIGFKSDRPIIFSKFILGRRLPSFSGSKIRTSPSTSISSGLSSRKGLVSYLSKFIGPLIVSYGPCG